MEHPDLLEGHLRFSDAGVFRLRSDLALVQSVDFFPPVVDDPGDFGRIAAANAMSDIYAMGGTPVTALNVAGFPSGKLDVEVLADIFAGGAEKVLEGGAVIVGGHTVEDSEIKYGLVVTGTIDPSRLVTNAGAHAGDRLLLTKALGTGSIATALKRGKTEESILRHAVESMCELNREASSLMLELGARGATDITGFGLLGHGYEMAESSVVTLVIESSRVPLLPGARELARRGLLSGGVERNSHYLSDKVHWKEPADPNLRALLYDSETSGGLLVALEEAAAEVFVRKRREAGDQVTCIIGEVRARGAYAVEVHS